MISEKLPSPTLAPRPRNLQELIQKETLNTESISSEFFNLDDISDDEEIWIMDIPKSIDPQELHGQTITLGDKSKIKIKEERYCVVAHNMKCNITCVCSTGKDTSQYKTVNIKPVGSLTVRRKLPGILKAGLVPSDGNSNMPIFPDKLKIRHPLLGVSYNDKLRRRSRKLKKKQIEI